MSDAEPTRQVAGAREVEALRGAYQALSAGDTGGALAVLHTDAVWKESSELPGGDTFRGRDAILDFLESFLESWQEFRQQIEDAVIVDDRVVLLIHLTAVGRGSGIELDTRYAHVWTMRDGEGVLVEAYRDQGEALAAVRAERREP